jgi:hypothetical protein
VSTDIESAITEADAERHRAWSSALDAIEDGDLTWPNAVRRLRTQYARIWREREKPFVDMIANAYAAKVAARRAA